MPTPNAPDLDALRTQAQIHLSAGRAETAALTVMRALEQHGPQPGLLRLAAMVLTAAGAPAQAVEFAEAARRASPDDGETVYTLGRVLRAAGRDAQAIETYRQALALDAGLLDAWLALGVALRATGQTVAAVAVYRQALARLPAASALWHNLANALQELGRDDEAAACRERIVLQGGPAARAAVAEAEAHVAAERHEAALQAWRRALQHEPTHLAARWGAARALVALARVDEARAALQSVLELAPGAADAWHLLGGLHEYQGRVADGWNAYDRAWQLSRHAASRICRDLLLPSVLPFGTDIDALRAEHAERLRALLHEPLPLADPLQDVSSGPVNDYFRLAYHGRCNRELHALYAQVFLHACPSLAWTAPHCRGDRSPVSGRRLRVGFISRFFRRHSIGKTSVGLIEQLSRERFEVFVLMLPPAGDDPMARRIAAGADHVLRLPAGLAESREAIAALELDILFYQDIGMEPHSYFLAFARLAPVQCVSFGHPDTTGIPAMDAWISSSGFEPPGAQAHYSERLVCIDGVGTLACYDRPQLPPHETVPRAGFGLPEGVPLMACPQTLYKFHPGLDDLIGAALARLPGARLLLVEGDVPALRPQLLERWRRRGDGIDRAALFLPSMEHASFLSLLQVADVVLDPLHFNGMNSSLEALAMGTPVVTLPTGLQRGRHTQGMYRRMEWTALVAEDGTQYVDHLVRLSRDRGERERARREILQRVPVLYGDQAVVRGFEAAFEQLARGAGLPA